MSSERSQTPLRFVQALSGHQIPAMKQAVRYLFRGPGCYPPEPAIVGVDQVRVTRIRDIGETLDPKQLQFLFEQKWNSRDTRIELLRHLPKPDASVPKRDDYALKKWYAQKWIEHNVPLVEQDLRSASYEVSFTGSAGTWSATINIDCEGFTNQPDVLIDHDRRHLIE